MQQSMQATRTGSGRREERVPRDDRIPFEAPIEVRTDDNNEPREAEGLNVSIGGLAMRASSVPALGATVACRFACPPAGEPITAKGQVVWSSPAGSTPGSFGVRFVELDTKSATCLRRYLGPRGELTEASGRLRSATIRIDGLGPSVEAELKLADETRVVLEQELSFLQLGRAVEVSVQGRGTERGRIASVELRRSSYDVPTIVYGVLLDSAPAREAPPSHPGAATVANVTPELTESADLPLAVRMSLMPAMSPPAPERITGRVSSPPRVGARRSENPGMRVSAAPRRDTILAAPVPPPPQGELAPGERPAMVAPPPVEPAAMPTSAAHSHARAYAPQPPLTTSTPAEASPEAASTDAEADETLGPDDELDDTVYERRPDRGGAMAMLRGLPLQVGLLTRALSARVRSFASAASEHAETLRGEGDELAPVDQRTRWLLRVARVRGFLLAIWSWLRSLATGNAGHASSRPPLRVQRATLPGIAPEDMHEDASTRLRIVAGVLIAAGLALGMYMVTAQGEADIELPKAPEPAPAAKPAEVEEPLVLELDGRPDPELEASPPAAAKRRAPKAVKNVEAPPVAEADVPAHELGESEDEVALDPPPSANGPALFGDAEVPNGRIFTLRMNGPVTTLTGHAREHGFTVRIPNRVAADRASPIATAHSAVARAMILNRPGFAELTIEFRPGQVPRYQVRGTGSALEITLERL